MKQKTIKTDLYNITISRASCRCGSCITEKILIEDSDDNTFIASYNISEEGTWKFGEDYSISTIAEILFELVEKTKE